MMISCAHNLYNKRQEVNDLNVFPVPDGDTGTNMSMTVSAMAKALEETIFSSASKAADAMSFATLRGARGNSGVILSQFFRGIAKELKGKDKINSKDFAEALKKGSDAAYKAVMNPTEGTILTVAREIAAAALKEAEINSDICAVFQKAIKRGNKVLLKTPDMLPALKQAGVVDAGGQGWLVFLEGALYYLENDKKIIKEESEAEEKPKETGAEAQKAVDTANIKYSYCTEFIIEKSKKDVDVLAFKRTIEKIGDSMLVIDDDDIVKVHIHTNNPGFVLERAVKLGAMINIKIDNMKHQHQSLIKIEEEKEEILPEKETAFVAVSVGDGLNEILKSMGIDYIIEGGQTMNPSTDDILNAVKKVNAKNVFVFPNNKNIILAAEQAKELAENNVIVMQSKNIPQCISAMIEYNDKKSAEDNEKKMSKAMGEVKVGQITFAVRDTEMDGVCIKEGDIIGITSGKIEITGENPDTVLKELVQKIADDDSEFLNIYYGEGVTEEQAQAVGAELEESFPDLEVSVKFGGQPLYYYILSAE